MESLETHQTHPTSAPSGSWRQDVSNKLAGGRWRRALGLFLLGFVVICWTASGFLTSSVFADGSYNKPFLITYINTAFFAVPLLPAFLIRFLLARRRYGPGAGPRYRQLLQNDSNAELLDENGEARNLHETTPSTPTGPAAAPLTVRETLHLSARFCGFWFMANWLNAISYSFTSVASSTIITSTASVFTLLFGALFGVETFTIKKLVGVFGSLAGIILISTIDTSGERDDADRGSFPYKTPGEIALGDAMALASAILYGLYATVLTKTIGDESRVSMPLFFGFIGAVAIVALWPGMLILHWTGLESFALPPSQYVWNIILVNAIISLFSDMSWAYAVLLTSPLVVTVGLTLNIPLSLVGQIIFNNQYTSPWYWLGAVIIVASFIFINHESKQAKAPVVQQTPPDD